MKVKNTTQRNIRLLAAYQYMTDPDTGKAIKAETGRPQISGTPYKVLIPAGSTLELKDDEWAKVAPAAEKLVKLGYLEFLMRPASPLTIAQIVSRVRRKAEVDLKAALGKEKLSKKAEDLKVDIWTSYTPEETEADIEREAFIERTKPKAKKAETKD